MSIVVTLFGVSSHSVWPAALQVWCCEAKRKVLGLLGLPPGQLELLTDDESAAQLHVGHWGMKPENLEPYLGGAGGWKRVIGFRPTGVGPCHCTALHCTNMLTRSALLTWLIMRLLLPTTGWTFKKNGGLQAWHQGDVSVYGVPYR